jgi:flagellar hook-length control protein FliK
MENISLSNLLFLNVTANMGNQLKNGGTSQSEVSSFTTTMEKAQTTRQKELQKTSNQQERQTTTQEVKKDYQASAKHNQIEQDENPTASVEEKPLNEKEIIANKDNSENTHEEKVETEETDEIVALIANTFQLNPQEVTQVLEEVGLEATDLLEEGNLNIFIEGLFQEDTATLLQNEELVNTVTKLWSELETQKELKDATVNVPLLNHTEALPLEESVKQLTSSEQSLETMNLPVQEEAPLEEVEILNVLEESADTNILQPSQPHQNEVYATLTNAEGTNVSEAELGTNLFLQPNIQEVKQNLQANFTQQIASKSTPATESFSLPELDNLEILSLKNGNEIELQLYPKELGKLSLKVVEHNGVVAAEIKVDSEKAKQLLLSNINQLKETFEQQGLTIGSFQVDVREQFHQSHMQRQRQKSSKRIQEILNGHFEEPEEIEETPRLQETQVDYMA